MKKGDRDKSVTRGLLDNAVDVIMKGMDGIPSEQDKHFNILEAGQRNLQRQISDLKYDTPT